MAPPRLGGGAGEACADFHFDHPVEQVHLAGVAGAGEDTVELGFGGEVGAFLDDGHMILLRV